MGRTESHCQLEISAHVRETRPAKPGKSIQRIDLSVERASLGERLLI